jgi:hypothetical protein
MKRLTALPLVLLSMATASWGQCFEETPKSQALPYRQGGELPVITGPFQFDLPGKLTALAATDGVMAILPNRQFVSYQLVTSQSIKETLDTFDTPHLSAAELDSRLYGLLSSALSPSDQQRLEDIRSDLRINCQHLNYYRVGDAVDLIFQEGDSSDAPHRILFFSGDATNLITVRGPKEMAMRVLQSIQQRNR